VSVSPDPDWNRNEATCTGRAAPIKGDFTRDASSYFHVEAEPKDLPASSDGWQVRRETSLPHGRYKWKQGSRRGKGL